MSAQVFTRIPDYAGHLVLNESGATIASGGELENDEKTAGIIYNLVTMTDHIDKVNFPGGFNSLSVCFEDYSYTICLSNKKLHIIKRKVGVGKQQQNSYETNISDLQVSISNSINA